MSGNVFSAPLAVTMQAIPDGDHTFSPMRFIVLFIVCAILLQGCSKEAETPGQTPILGTPEQLPPEGFDESSASFGVYHAIIIGIENYHNWPRLHQAEDDAQELQRVLSRYYGFAPENMELLYGENATRSNILNAIEQKFRHLTDNDNLLVFYAGHGQIDELSDSGYWIPVEGDLADSSTWIRFSTISEYLKSSKVEANDLAIITDSCYGGALLSAVSRAVSRVPTSDDDYSLYYSTLEENASARSRRVLASGGPDEEVPDDSLFASLFTQALENNTHRYVDLDLLFRVQVYPAMITRTVQDAELFSYESREGDKGHFVFVRQDYVADDADLSDTPIEVDETLPQAGVATVTIRSNVVGDEVRLDGVNRGSTRLDVNVIPGEHHLQVSAPGYHPFETNFDVAIGQHKTITARLEPVVMPKPEIAFFNSDVNTVRPGESTELTWQTRNAETVVISGVGSIARSGNLIISPSTTTTYTLVAENNDGDSTQQTVEVKVVANAPVIKHFEVKPREIRKGEEVTISWGTSDAVRVTLAQRQIGLNGTQTVKPRRSQSLVLVATNEAGDTVEASVDINVIDGPKVTKFSAERTSIRQGSTTRLYWQTEGADGVVIDGVGRFRSQGYVDVKPEKTTVYELIAYGGDQKHVDKLEIKVTPGWQVVSPTPRIPVEIKPAVLEQPPATLDATDKAKLAAGFVVADVSKILEAQALSTVVVSNQLSLKQTYTADLDTGRVSAGTASDIWFNANTATARYLSSKNGALLGPIMTSPVNAKKCRELDLKSRSHPVQKLVAGTSVCVKTNKGHVSLLEVIAASGPSPGTLKTKFTTWR